MPLRKLDLSTKISGQGWEATKIGPWVEFRVLGPIEDDITLPKGFIPARQTYIPVSAEMTDTFTPRLAINHAGVVTKQGFTYGWGLGIWRAA